MISPGGRIAFSNPCRRFLDIGCCNPSVRLAFPEISRASRRARAARISLAATSDVHLSISLSLCALSCHAPSLYCPMFSAKATEEGFNHPETINRRQSLEEKWRELAEITAQRPRLSEKFLHNSSITLPARAGRAMAVRIFSYFGQLLHLRGSCA